MTTAGERIKQLREGRGLTQQQLADAVGSKQTSVASVERRGSRSSKVLPRIAAFFGVNALWLAEGKGPQSIADNPVGGIGRGVGESGGAAVAPDDAALLAALKRLRPTRALLLRAQILDEADVAARLDADQAQRAPPPPPKAQHSG